LVTWLAESGRIQVAMSVESFVREMVARVILKQMTPAIAALAVRMPERYTRDPADRNPGATAMFEGMPLVTADKQIRQAKVAETIW
jgi:PIN domain nuclease of toxin-antitoxin system